MPVTTLRLSLTEAADVLGGMDARLTAAMAGRGLAAAATGSERVLIEAIRTETPVRTGRLRDSTTGEIAYAGGNAEVRVGQTATTPWNGEPYPIAQFVLSGHGEYDIYPVNKQALYWEGAEHPVAHVHMPAKESNPYVDRALEAAAEPLNTVLGQAARLMLESAVLP